MSTMMEIEERAAQYARAREALATVVSVLQAEIDACRRAAMPALRAAVSDAADRHSRLKAALQESKGEFQKPKTRIFHGIKVGYMKQRGEVVIEDEEATIRRIRERLPQAQVELLIKTRESVVRGAVYDLIAGDLKRLGIEIENDTEVAVIKPVDSEVDKLVAALLAEAEKIEEAA